MSDHHVRIAHHAVARGNARLVAIGLGSCVAVTLYDPRQRVGGLAHVLLPDPSVARDASNPGRFASEAVPMLLEGLRAQGGRPPFVAKIAGGAALFGQLLGSSTGQMGERNVVATRAALARAGIPIVAEDTGGNGGRSITFDVATGDLTVRGVRGGQRVL
ncbi:MAG: chemotaxis protein CheD [Gemmatimonadaceae bacterium]